MLVSRIRFFLYLFQHRPIFIHNIAKQKYNTQAKKKLPKEKKEVKNAHMNQITVHHLFLD
jgi:hypothetical protein